MQKILVIYAHPNPQESKVNRAFITAAAELESVIIHDLYHHYPDFDIDIKLEQDLLEQADIIVFQHPLYWYSCPAILKEWLDVVLQNGFAYGDKGSKLRDKKWLPAITMGGDLHSYSSKGKHHYSIAEFLIPFERTAAFCEMTFLPAFVCHEATHLDQQQLNTQTQRYLDRLIALAKGEGQHA